MTTKILQSALWLWTSGCVFISDDEYAQRLQQATPSPALAEDPCIESQWYPDADGDGLGDSSAPVQDCEAPAGSVENGDDCDDQDATVQLGTTWYKDLDGDGYGNASDVVVSCEAPAGSVADDSDCDDENIGVNPGAVENCASLVDDDCDGDRNDPGADGCTDFYVDGDGDGFGDEASSCLCEAADPYLGTNDMDCDDADPEVHPDAEEICNNGVDDDCDGSAGACGLTGERSVSEADAILLGTADDGRAGSAVSAVGDVTGDGVPDLVVGAYNADGASGRSYLVPGPVSGEQSLDTFASWSGEETQHKLGRDVANVGDVTGDGLADLVFGAPQHGTNRGKLYVLAGPIEAASDLMSDADATVIGLSNASYTGRNFDAVGDFDGDGNADLIVGAIGHKDDAVATGAAILVPGPIDGEVNLSTDPDVLVFVGEAGGELGRDVLGMGDFTGDGLDEIALGARRASASTGWVYIVQSGAAATGTMDVADADHIITGSQAGALLGQALASGDVNGDGGADLLIAAPNWDADGGGGTEGAVYLVSVVSSGDALDVADVIVTGETVGGNLGEGVTTLSDRDGDGNAEIAIGVPGGVGGKGKVLVFYAPTTGTLVESDADAVLLGDATGGRLGTSIADVGDMDADGLLDLVVGAPDADASSSQEGIVYFMNGGGL